MEVSAVDDASSPLMATLNRRARNVAHHLRPTVARDLVHYRRRGFGQRLRAPSGALRFTPHPPRDLHVLWKVCQVLGLRITTEDPHARASILWHDDTLVPARFAEPGMLNGRCLDISKQRVDEAMQAAFGYRLAVDPRTWSGTCVRKSDRNAAHDGTLLQCPAPAEPGLVYQRVVDNTVAGGLVEDLRAVVVGTDIPLVYVKRRPQRTRFSNVNTAVELAAPEALFSDDERSRILDLSAEMGVDVGEMDILRDRTDGQIHVVDVNRTCYGPPNGLDRDDGRRAVASIAASFARSFL
jgi:hypothetical protein